MELLISAAPLVMSALLTLNVSVCYMMLLRQESKTSAVSRDSLSPPSSSGGGSARDGILSQASSAACPACLTIEIMINQSIKSCLFCNQCQLQKNTSFYNMLWFRWRAFTSVFVCMNAADWNLLSLGIRNVLHSSIISENIHYLAFTFTLFQNHAPLPSPPPSWYLTKAICGSDITLSHQWLQPTST